MVCGTWLCLTTVVSWVGHVLIWMGTLGCSAERLRVVLPPSGPDSIHAEDLQRDVWSQLNPDFELEPNVWLSRRFEQHNAEFEPEDGSGFCAHQSSSKKVYWAPFDSMPHSLYWKAILLSLSKGSELEANGSFCMSMQQPSQDFIDLQSEITQDNWDVLDNASANEIYEALNYEALAIELRELVSHP